MKERYTVVIAEDCTIVREGLRAILSSESGLEVVGEAEDGRDAVRCAQETEPDLLLMDLSMPRMNGLDAIKEVKRLCPGTRILVLTVHKTEEHVFASLKAGADGYILKESNAAELLQATRNVLQGKQYLSPEISRSVVEGYVGGRRQPRTGSAWDSLTDRERQVLKMIAEGNRNREIGDFLCISPKTVERHRANLMAKLDLHSTAALTAYAIEKGLRP